MDRLDELAVFAAVVEEGSLAAAARRLGRSPPAMTRILAGLEARLGVRLAERTTRRLRPTEAGRRLASDARRVLAEYAASLAVAAGEAVPRGVLRVAAPLVFGRRHLAPIIGGFLVDNPGVTVELVLSDRPAGLVEEELDVALRIGALPESALVARRVGVLRRVLAASPEYLARRGTPADPAALAAHDAVVFWTRPGTAPEWNFAGITVRPHARFVVNQAEAAVAAAVAGNGVVRALSYQVAEELAAGRLVRLLRAHEPSAIPVQLLWLGGAHLPSRVRAFLDYAAPRLAALPILAEA